MKYAAFFRIRWLYIDKIFVKLSSIFRSGVWVYSGLLHGHWLSQLSNAYWMLSRPCVINIYHDYWLSIVPRTEKCIHLKRSGSEFVSIICFSFASRPVDEQLIFACKCFGQVGIFILNMYFWNSYFSVACNHWFHWQCCCENLLMLSTVKKCIINWIIILLLWNWKINFVWRFIIIIIIIIIN